MSALVYVVSDRSFAKIVRAGHVLRKRVHLTIRRMTADKLWLSDDTIVKRESFAAAEREFNR